MVVVHLIIRCALARMASLLITTVSIITIITVTTTLIHQQQQQHVVVTVIMARAYRYIMIRAVKSALSTTLLTSHLLH